jgi:hypothetical protein
VPPDPEDAAPISTPHGGHTSCGTAETGQDHSNDGACMRRFDLDRIRTPPADRRPRPGRPNQPDFAHASIAEAFSART